MPEPREQMVQRLAQTVAREGGRVYYVGGFVRDRLLGRENKDIDVEVHGVTPAQLEAILDTLGHRMQIGESFGVYALKGYDVDIAMPRCENATGRGHKDFAISVDPFIGTKKAATRRDFTINAMMEDVLTGEIVDHFGGQEDLKNGLIRHVNDLSFAEDPLRVLRGAQFAARFRFAIAPETIALCRTMDLSALSRERIEGEMKKALLKAEEPSIFWNEMRRMNQLSHWFPELEALIGLEQSPKFHPEGDVWTHTLCVLDKAALLRHRAVQPFPFMMSALCHDIGKAVTSEEIDGVIHAYKHEVEGLPLVEQLLTRLTGEKKLIAYVLNMVENHMRPNTMARHQSSLKATNHLFDDSLEPLDLILLAMADAQGTGTYVPDHSSEAFLLERLDKYRGLMQKPAVMGRDLIEAGLKPDSTFTDLLAYAHKLHLAGVPKELALRQTLSYARQLKAQNADS